MNADTENTTSQSDIVYPLLSYRMKAADDGTTVRYDYKWNDTGKALTEEEVKVVENCRKSMKLMKYIVLKSWNDYDCSAPCAEIVDDTTYGSWQEAYDAIVKDMLKTYDVSSLDEIEYAYELPSRDKIGDYTHKCGSAWIDDTDCGQMLYNIQTIKID